MHAVFVVYILTIIKLVNSANNYITYTGVFFYNHNAAA